MPTKWACLQATVTPAWLRPGMMLQRQMQDDIPNNSLTVFVGPPQPTMGEEAPTKGVQTLDRIGTQPELSSSEQCTAASGSHDTGLDAPADKVYPSMAPSKAKAELFPVSRIHLPEAQHSCRTTLLRKPKPHTIILLRVKSYNVNLACSAQVSAGRTAAEDAPRSSSSAVAAVPDLAGATAWQPDVPGPQRFKKAMQSYYSARSATYDDEGAFHPSMIQHIIELADLAPGHRVLDLCAGTGLFAMRAAEIIGRRGAVIAVDFSRPMLNVLAAKQADLPWHNVACLHADVEKPLPLAAQFDRIVCASALVLLRDIPTTLGLWREMLTPGGRMVLDGPASTAFVAGILLAEAAEELGLTWPVYQVLGSEDAARSLLAGAGLQLVSFTQRQYGDVVTLKQMQRGWDRSLPFLEPATPPELREPMKRLFMAKAVTWFGGQSTKFSDGTMNFVVAQRLV